MHPPLALAGGSKSKTWEYLSYPEGLRMEGSSVLVHLPLPVPTPRLATAAVDAEGGRAAMVYESVWHRMDQIVGNRGPAATEER